MLELITAAIEAIGGYIVGVLDAKKVKISTIAYISGLIIFIGFSLLVIFTGDVNKLMDWVIVISFSLFAIIFMFLFLSVLQYFRNRRKQKREMP